jgi:transglycosylase-like protein with SLT domain
MPAAPDETTVWVWVVKEFPVLEVNMAMEIAKLESGYVRDIIGAAGEIGIFQIHPPSWEAELIREHIISKRDDLKNIEKNVKAAHYIWKKSGWEPWSTYPQALTNLGESAHERPENEAESPLETISPFDDWNDIIDPLGRFIKVLTSADFWKRIGLAALGIFVIIVALILYNRGTIEKVATKGML